MSQLPTLNCSCVNTTVGNDGDGHIINALVRPWQPKFVNGDMHVKDATLQTLDPYNMGLDSKTRTTIENEMKQYRVCLEKLVITPEVFEESRTHLSHLTEQLMASGRASEYPSDTVIFSYAVWKHAQVAVGCSEKTDILMSTEEKYKYNDSRTSLHAPEGCNWTPFADHGDGLIINLCPLNGSSASPLGGVTNMQHLFQILDPYKSVTREGVSSAAAKIEEISKHLPSTFTGAEIESARRSYADLYGHSRFCPQITAYVGLVHATREAIQENLQKAGHTDLNFMVSTPTQFSLHTRDSLDNLVVVQKPVSDSSPTEAGEDARSAISSLGFDWDSASDLQMSKQLQSMVSQSTRVTNGAIVLEQRLNGYGDVNEGWTTSPVHPVTQSQAFAFAEGFQDIQMHEE